MKLAPSVILLALLTPQARPQAQDCGCPGPFLLHDQALEAADLIPDEIPGQHPNVPAGAFPGPGSPPYDPCEDPLLKQLEEWGVSFCSTQGQVCVCLAFADLTVTHVELADFPLMYFWGLSFSGSSAVLVCKSGGAPGQPNDCFVDSTVGNLDCGNCNSPLDHITPMCDTPCLKAPWIDANDDGVPWPSDPSEGAWPFPEYITDEQGATILFDDHGNEVPPGSNPPGEPRKHPWGDSDGDGIPHHYDFDIDNDGRPDKGGLLPPDLLEPGAQPTASEVLQIFAESLGTPLPPEELGFEDLPADFTGDLDGDGYPEITDGDVNNDGFFFVSEAARYIDLANAYYEDALLAIHDEVRSIFSENYPQGTTTIFQYKQELASHVNTAKAHHSKLVAGAATAKLLYEGLVKAPGVEYQGHYSSLLGSYILSEATLNLANSAELLSVEVELNGNTFKLFDLSDMPTGANLLGTAVDYKNAVQNQGGKFSALPIGAELGDLGALKIKAGINFDADHFHVDAQLKAAHESTLALAASGNESQDGDPVNTLTGHFELAVSDLEISVPGFQLRLDRYYDSGSTYAGHFGTGWEAPLLDTRILVWPGSRVAADGAQYWEFMTCMWGDGRQTTYRQSSDPLRPFLYIPIRPDGTLLALDFSGEFDGCGAGAPGLRIRQADGREFVFCPPMQKLNGWEIGLSYLDHVRTPEGLELGLRRNAKGYVESIIEPLGREVAIAYGENLRQPQSATDWSGRTIGYSYSAVTGQVSEVVYPERPVVGAQGDLISASPKVEYIYSGDAYASYEDVDDSLIATNLLEIRKNGNVILQNFYGESGAELAYDKVTHQVREGATTAYRYESFSVPYPQEYGREYSLLVQSLTQEGELRSYYSLEGEAVVAEIANARYAANWTAVPGSGQALADGSDPGAWYNEYEYDSLSRLIGRSASTAARYQASLPPMSREVTSYVGSGAGILDSHVQRIESYGADGASFRVTEMTYEPVTGGVVTRTLPGGGTLHCTYDHQEMGVDEVAASASAMSLYLWGILTPSDEDAQAASNQAAHFGLGDVNGDGVIGASFQLTVVSTPPVTLADPSGLDGGASVVQRATISRFDAFGQVISETDEAGIEVRHLWDRGRITQTIVDPAGIAATTNYLVDDLGRVVSSSGPDGTTRVEGFDAGGNTLEVRLIPASGMVLPSGVAESDLSGLTSAISSPFPLVTRHFYDLDGNVVATSLGKSEPGTAVAYPAEVPEDVEVTHAYDQLGNALSSTAHRFDSTGAPIGSATSTQTFDSVGRLTQGTSALGVTTRYHYHPAGGVSREEVVGAGGGLLRASEMLLNSQGLPGLERLEVAGEPTVEARTDYDAQGRVVRRFAGDGSYEFYQYNDLDLPTIIQKRVGGASTYDVVSTSVVTYDESGREISLLRSDLAWDGAVEAGGVAPKDIESHTGWGVRPDQVNWSRRGNELVRYGYDSAGRQTLVERVEPGGGGAIGSTGYLLDAAGRLISSTQLRPGAQVGSANPVSSTTHFGYDQFARLVVTKNALGQLDVRRKDARGRLIREYRVGGRRERLYEYTSAGELTRVTDVDRDGLVPSRSSVTTVDKHGRSVEFRDPNGGLTTFEYAHPRGLLSKRVEELGKFTAFEYDALDRLTREFGQAGNERLIEYRPLGQQGGGAVSAITASLSGAATVAREFKSFAPIGLPSVIEETVGGSPKVTTSRAYFADGTLALESGIEAGYTSAGAIAYIDPTSAGGQRRSGYIRDGAGRVTGISRGVAASPVLLLGGHWGAGAPTTFDVPGGSAGVRYQHDALGRMTGCAIQGTGGAGVTLLGESYSWSVDGNLESRTRWPAARLETFEYDPYDRLVAWNVDYGSQGVPVEVLSWQIDANDNVRRINSVLPEYAAAFDINALNQVGWWAPTWGPFSYDAQGNELQRGPGGSGRAVHTWDALNRPRLSTFQDDQGAWWRVRWTYDGLDRVIKKEHELAAGDAPGQMREYEWFGMYLIGGHHDGVHRCDYLYMPGQASPIAADMQGGGGLELRLPSHQGSLIGTTDGASVSSEYSYRPYGEVWDAMLAQPLGVGDSQEDLLYLSRLHDLGTQELRFGARTYDARLGRFLSQDPIGLAGGSNLYSYAMGNPLRYADPTGYHPEDAQAPGDADAAPDFLSSNREIASYVHQTGWGSSVVLEELSKRSLAQDDWLEVVFEVAVLKKSEWVSEYQADLGAARALLQSGLSLNASTAAKELTMSIALFYKAEMLSLGLVDHEAFIAVAAEVGSMMTHGNAGAQGGVAMMESVAIGVLTGEVTRDAIIAMAVNEGAGRARAEQLAGSFELAEIASGVGGIKKALGEAKESLAASAARGAARSLDDLSAAGRVPGKGGLTRAGREYQKHMGRGELPKVPGRQLDQAGQGLLDDILTNPGTTVHAVTSGRAAGGTRFIGPNGAGATFGPDGSLAYFGRY